MDSKPGSTCSSDLLSASRYRYRVWQVEGEQR